jgi:hypothetical protein
MSDQPKVDPLAAARKHLTSQPITANKVTRRTIIMIPDGCHLMIPASMTNIVQEARFIRLTEAGGIQPLPMQNVATTTIPVADQVLEALDTAYFQQFQGANK